MKHTHLLASALTLATLSAQLWAHSANEAAPKTDSGWKQRQELLNQRAAEAGSKAQVLFIGDSITQGWEGAGKTAWAKYYAHRNAVNLGIGGDRTQHVLWRVENGEFDGIKPKAVVLMIGTNNSGAADNPPEQIAAGIKNIIAAIHQRSPNTRVLLLAIFPRGATEANNPGRAKNQAVNALIAKFDDGQKVRYLDIGAKFLTADGTLEKSVMPDLLHLNAVSYQIWADAIREPLAALVK